MSLPRIRTRRWPMVTAFAIALVVMAAVVLVAWAVRYQPLGYGDTGVSNLDYPGLPAAQGARAVNTFGRVRQDVYIPAQREGYTFYLFADIANDGSRTVTIESVGLPPGSALTPAGPARYAQPDAGNGAPGIPPAREVLHRLTLRPGHEILAAIPVRSWPCWTKGDAYETVPAFTVTYQFSFFTHATALPWNPEGGELILHAPFGRPGQPDVVCRPGI
jgi:hypothetical protein